jgi:cobalt/nickel transport system ATP-binding protein
LVFTTHDVELAYRFADEVALFDRGTTLAQGATAEILANHELLKAAGLEAPLLLKLGLRARELGILSAQEPLPRSADAALGLLKKT